MAKDTKKVGDWTHRSGLSADIELRGGTRFVATFLEREFSAPARAVLEKQLEDFAELWLNVEWFPVIVAETNTDRHLRSRGYYRNVGADEEQEENLGFKVKRFYVGKTPTGELYSVEWDIAPEYRKAEMRVYRDEPSKTMKLAGLPLRAPLKLNDGEYMFAYTPEVWANCENILEGIANLRAAISKLFRNKAGLALMQSAEPLRLLSHEQQ